MIGHDGLCMHNRVDYLAYHYTCVINLVLQVSANPIVNLIQSAKRAYTSRNFLVEQLEFDQATLTRLRLKYMGNIRNFEVVPTQGRMVPKDREKLFLMSAFNHLYD